MRARADTVIVQSFTYTTANGKKLPLRNILARFRPELTERVLYLTHWDSRPIAESAATEAGKEDAGPGANDGASGVGMFIALGESSKRRSQLSASICCLPTARTTADSVPRRWTSSSARKYFADHLPSPGLQAPLRSALGHDRRQGSANILTR